MQLRWDVDVAATESLRAKWGCGRGERLSYPKRGEAQSLFSMLGKVIRITTDAKPVPGNPFENVGQPEDHTLPEIWSYGHRNPQSRAINPTTGDF